MQKNSISRLKPRESLRVRAMALGLELYAKVVGPWRSAGFCRAWAPLAQTSGNSSRIPGPRSSLELARSDLCIYRFGCTLHAQGGDALALTLSSLDSIACSTGRWAKLLRG